MKTNRAGNSAGLLDPRVGNGWIWSAGVPGRPGGRRGGLQAATNGTPKSFSRPPPSRKVATMSESRALTPRK